MQWVNSGQRTQLYDRYSRRNMNEVYHSKRRKSKHWDAHVQTDVWHTQHIHPAENNKLLSQAMGTDLYEELDFFH